MKKCVCYTIALIAFMALVGFTGGAADNGDIGAYIIKALVCLAVMAGAVFAAMIEVKTADE